MLIEKLPTHETHGPTDETHEWHDLVSIYESQASYPRGGFFWNFSTYRKWWLKWYPCDVHERDSGTRKPYKLQKII